MDRKSETETRVSGRGETDRHRLACSFTNSMLDSLRVQNGCALNGDQGLH